jgi:hypothetical protein
MTNFSPDLGPSDAPADDEPESLALPQPVAATATTAAAAAVAMRRVVRPPANEFLMSLSPPAGRPVLPLCVLNTSVLNT